VFPDRIWQSVKNQGKIPVLPGCSKLAFEGIKNEFGDKIEVSIEGFKVDV
jgi:hypothetical protein